MASAGRAPGGGGREPAGLSRTTAAALAGVAASAAFLGLYLGAGLAWWAALGLGAAVYAGAVLVIPHRRQAFGIARAEGVTEADLRAALAQLAEAQERMARLAERAQGDDASAFRRMADLLGRIRDHHKSDPDDLRLSRRFLRSYLPRMLDSSEAYVDLAARADAGAGRLAVVGGRVRGFVPALERIERACVENDMTALEVEVEVLGEQIAARGGRP
ncbi:5-bromo-4-chloroindolyl phosphate hydrolysis family protein [Rubrimonas cliftonensis]|uniref:5-bromo-4-chloroindolyl phosphate hydrolysis protein n=1 Tax=Rubrimonas cliftonensis TaxID=89524 RepID=A0A1H4G2Y0_9RHOB|nr:5-bromo-4-chloroindolyl phosphate hydrolysis family protein [Rubrimonas cliftonensis]SEB03963.1 5-bromo-4-chloroindolyl phosphate hydrolysis protein [Rubrimonas cliftonensis]